MIKKIMIMIVVLFFVNNIYASNVLTPNATSVTIPQQNASAPTESPRFEKCLQWKQVCYTNSYCFQRERLRNGCYRCVKPGRYGFHVYPRQVDRTTCNQDTADYLINMGYVCYHSYELSPCLQSREKEFCDSQCVKYAN
ncbi:MAG TPA: hypothetical protein VJK30_04265 [Coxiellaceae bacterium]|nr:MAG: hypothetical protein A3E81_06495 [Gammaproteobacteria bacterium RIFCSPHIGHO2_12_FULL_36_30]HLB56524.1 hypothetical protein [Coxiellaceae bacterium]